MKRTQIKRRPMADSVLKTLEPEEKPYRERDSNGLYLEVKPTGTKSWLLRYKRTDGKWAWQGLGGFPAVSGKVARAQAEALLGKASEGEDIWVYKEAVQPKVTFREVGEEWYTHKVNAGRAVGTTRQMRIYLDKDVFPVIGDKPLDEVTRADCAKIQSNMEARGAHVLAGKVSGWIKQIYHRAIGQGKCEVNPASQLSQIAEAGPGREHYPHLLEPELPAFLRALRQSQARAASLVMVRLVLRNGCRPGVARFAEWSEFDLENGNWSIPAAKMKMRRDFVMPLPNQTLKELRDLKEITGRGRYVFPGIGPKNDTMSENTINKLLRTIGYKDKLVGHGCRHTMSTLLREHGWNRDYVEVQLAHVEAGVAGVYNKAQYLEKRREMVQWYSDYLDALEAGIQSSMRSAAL